MFRRESKPQSWESTWAKTYGSKEVAKLAKVTPRQLQWWDEQDVVMPRHEGHKRFYSHSDLLEVCILGELRMKGFSLQRLRKVLLFLRKQQLPEILANCDKQPVYILTDGRSHRIETDQDRTMDLLCASRAQKPIYVVRISEIVARVNAAL